MYNNHIHRKVDGRGRITISKNVRDVYGLDGATLEIFTENDLIILRKVDDPHAHRRRSIRDGTKGTSMCNFCICSSCIGFRCPWAFGYVGRGNTGETPPDRCTRCVEKGYTPIHDCDFYNSKKRKKIYRVKFKRKKTKHGKVMSELKEIKELIVKTKYPPNSV
jgi:bifunctional DNA-binding transcriptional regulator/antitoxin component of YhaV-PrlF toxin-antitoxin module